MSSINRFLDCFSKEALQVCVRRNSGLKCSFPAQTQTGCHGLAKGQYWCAGRLFTPVSSAFPHLLYLKGLLVQSIQSSYGKSFFFFFFFFPVFKQLRIMFQRSMEKAYIESKYKDLRSQTLQL